MDKQPTDILPFKDSDGKELRLGDKVKGDGSLRFQDGYEIDRTHPVTIRIKDGKYYFGGLSINSFDRFYKVEEK